ncbi:Nucleolar protein 5A [Tubulinosema ratisbonensis]|uniref:Nucleolar protein 5A n=1 Tax=Tubulinosema ratisbonensis TaxID=291195 RepID=A0A437AHJ4_9MICR|nr:Nucleolar protein 5A [Tubulinosema ratisbonensis]
MSNENKSIFYLLTKGYSKKITSITNLNKHLLPMKYEAVLWYDKSVILLKDNTPSFKIENPVNITKAKQIINNILEDKLKDFCSETMEYLIRNNWVEKIGQEYFITKRFMVQFEDYLLKSGNFFRCRYCSFAVKSKSYHDFCNDKYMRGYKQRESSLK